MRLLITAGVTQVPIDQVRVITSIFTGRTGTRIALEANRRGHEVTLLTSAPHLVGEQLRSAARWQVKRFRTFDELHDLLSDLVPTHEYEAIIHSAAVSDYRVASIHVCGPSSSAVLPHDSEHESAHFAVFSRRSSFPGPGPASCGMGDEPGGLACEMPGKIPSTYSELWLRLVPTPKLVDLIRSQWGFPGVLVKFKLESGVNEGTLLQRAEQSRLRSAADLMVANVLESVATTAWLGPINGQYRKLSRHQLASALLDAIEHLVPYHS